MLSAGVMILLRCTGMEPLAGAGSETTNCLTGVIAQADGNPAPNTVVRLVPASYNVVKDSTLPALLTDTTNARGEYRFTHLDPGAYTVQAIGLADRARTIIFNVHYAGDSAVAPLGTLLAPGIIKVMLPDSVDKTAGYLFVPGTTFFVFLNGTGFVVLDSVPAGTVPVIYYAAITSAAEKVIRYNVPVPTADTVVITNPSWEHARKLYLNTSGSGANIQEDVYNFPVLIRLTKNNFDFSQAKSDGSDLRFSKTDNTFLSYEIERWDPANSAAEVWVKVDTVFGNNSVQSVFMYWGNPGIAGASSGMSVFDTSNGFQGVWHLDDRASAQCSDATANHFNGVRYGMTSASTVPGIAGNGQAFDGKSSDIIMSNTSSGKLNFPENGTYALSAWVYADSLDNNYHFIVTKGNEQYCLQLDNNNSWDFFEFHAYQGWQGTGAAGTAKAWKYIVGVRSGPRQYLYVDGIIADSTIATAPDSTDNRITVENVCIGSRYSANNRWFNGVLDEVRIRSRTDGPDWIKLCFMNQRPDDKLVLFK